MTSLIKKLAGLPRVRLGESQTENAGKGKGGVRGVASKHREKQEGHAVLRKVTWQSIDKKCRLI